MHLSIRTLTRLSMSGGIAALGAAALTALTALALGSGCSSPGGAGGYTGYGGVAAGGSGGESGADSGGGSGSGGAAGSSSGSSSGAATGSSSGGGSGSSSSGGSDAGAGAMTLGTGSWTDGQTLASSVIIGAGATVTIDPAATVNLGAGVTITVLGTLTASSAAAHAKLTGAAWTGIVVASGGTLSLDGVDLVNAASAIVVQKGAAAAAYDDATITAATAPFTIAAGAALTTRKSTVAGTLGSSAVSGALTASYLDYDSNGHTGIETLDPAAQLSIEDSTMHGSGPSADFLVASAGAAKFHVAYSSISNVHCAFHFDTLSEFDVSYANIDGNAFGFMLYGSGGAGPFTVSDSNLYSNAAYDYDTQGSNAPITFDHVYAAGATNPGNAVTATNAQTAKVAGTGPR